MVLREAADAFSRNFELFPPHANNVLNQAICELQLDDLERSLAPQIARLVEKRRADILHQIKIRLSNRVSQIVNETKQPWNSWKVSIFVNVDSITPFAREARNFKNYPDELKTLATHIYSEDSQNLVMTIDPVIAAQRTCEGSRAMAVLVWVVKGIALMVGLSDLAEKVANWFPPAQMRGCESDSDDTTE
jgi:hypothetical protein